MPSLVQLFIHFICIDEQKTQNKTEKQVCIETSRISSLYKYIEEITFPLNQGYSFHITINCKYYCLIFNNMDANILVSIWIRRITYFRITIFSSQMQERHWPRNVQKTSSTNESDCVACAQMNILPLIIWGLKMLQIKFHACVFNLLKYLPLPHFISGNHLQIFLFKL